MSHTEHEDPILRTSPARVGKMLAILLGIMIIGGTIFFLNYGYWNSYLPTAGKIQESLGKSAAPGQGQATGKTINVNLSFVESPDFKVYAFNTVSLSDPNHNPTINANVGDKIEFNVKNAGKSFHAFAITASTSGPGPAIDGTTIGTADNPMKPGSSGEVSFVPSKAGTYYYICAVPGHRELGMEGKIIVAAGTAAPSGATVKATGNKVEFTVSFVMSADFKQYAFDALPGQPGTNPDITVKSGDTVTIHVKNDSKSYHAFGVVTDPNDPSSVLWDSAFGTPDDPLKPGQSGDVTFVAGAPGTYHYICTVPGHAALGMDAKFIVE
ncbi:MAG: plastocyanin/azurin family copper-binding protein [Candidatus Nitrosotalea sp.]|nr:plastocyanin/azurin family copper-binding protein [Candidatus Nitrosotalea sp.]